MKVQIIIGLKNKDKRLVICFRRNNNLKIKIMNKMINSKAYKNRIPINLIHLRKRLLTAYRI